MFAYYYANVHESKISIDKLSLRSWLNYVYFRRVFKLKRNACVVAYYTYYLSILFDLGSVIHDVWIVTFKYSLFTYYTLEI